MKKKCNKCCTEHEKLFNPSTHKERPQDGVCSACCRLMSHGNFPLGGVIDLIEQIVEEKLKEKEE